MRNLKLLEKYQPSPPPPPKKNLNLQENEKNITPRKSFNHPKIASTIMKKLQTPPLEKFSISQKTLTLSEKISTPLK